MDESSVRNAETDKSTEKRRDCISAREYHDDSESSPGGNDVVEDEQRDSKIKPEVKIEISSLNQLQARLAGLSISEGLQVLGLPDVPGDSSRWSIRSSRALPRLYARRL